MPATSGSLINETCESKTLVGLLRRVALYHGGRTAYSFLSDVDGVAAHLTYDELDQSARNIATLLQGMRFSGELALLLYPPGLDYIKAFFGCLYAGVVPIPAYPPRPNRPIPRIQAILRDARPPLVLTTANILADVERRSSHTPELKAAHWLSTDAETLASGDEWRAPKISADTLAVIQYTSGSTSKPKGVMLSHGNLMHNLGLIREGFHLGQEEVGVFWLPPYHDMGLIGSILEPMYIMGSAVLMSPAFFLQRPARWLQMISQHRATISGAPNFAFNLCVEKVTPEQMVGLELSRWRLAFCGAEPIHYETLRRFHKTFAPYGFRRDAFYSCYGLAEATLFACGGCGPSAPVVTYVQRKALEQNLVVPTNADAPDSVALVGCGSSLPGQQVLVVDPEQAVPVPEGHVGEIWIAGASVAQGYLHREEESTLSFRARLACGDGPFLRTGDLGYWSDNQLYITGRLNDLIIIRGRNHYPQDLEQSAGASHQSLNPFGAASFTVPNPAENDVRLVIVHELNRRHERGLDVAEVTQAVRRAIAERHELDLYSVVLVRALSLPRTSSGKIQRFLCRDQFLRGHLKVVGEWVTPSPECDLTLTSALPSPEKRSEARPSLPEIEARLIRLLARVLNIDRSEVSVHTPFNSYGISSIQVVGLSFELEELLGREISPALLYGDWNIKKLAKHLSSDECDQEALALATASKATNNGDGSLPGTEAKGAGRATSDEIKVALKNQSAAGTNTVIESLGVYLPSRLVSTADVLRGCRNSVSFPLEEVTGIKYRPVANPREFSIDLAKRAIEDCLVTSKYTPGQIQMLICCNISKCDGPNLRFSFEPSTALQLKAHFGFKHALTFDINNACAGIFTGIAIADTFLQTGIVNNALIVTGEYISHLTKTAQQEIEGALDSRMACLTLGVAGAAVTLESSNRSVGFHDLELHTLSRYSSYCTAEMSRNVCPGAIMYTDSINLASVAIEAAVKNATEILGKHKLEPEAFQHFVFHQTSKTSLDTAIQEVNRNFGRQVCDRTNVINNLTDRGNTATTTHFVAMAEGIRSGRINSGDRILFGIEGSGLTIGTALYTLDDLPDRLRAPQADARSLLTSAVVPRLPRSPGRPRIRINSAGRVRRDSALRDHNFDLIRMAAEDCFSRATRPRQDIDLLIHTGLYRENYLSEPAVAAMAADFLGLNGSKDSVNLGKLLAFDLCSGAVGFLQASHVASRMIQAGRANVAMILSSEVETNGQYFPSHNYGIGGTASALILERADTLERADHSGAGFGSFLFRDFTQKIESYKAFTSLKQNKPFLNVIRSPHLEEQYVRFAVSTVEELLTQEDLDISRIKVIIPPQISSSLIRSLVQAMGVEYRCFVDLTEAGSDFLTSSVAFGLQHVIESGRVSPGDIALILSVGSGIQIGCTTYRF